MVDSLDCLNDKSWMGNFIKTKSSLIFGKNRDIKILEINRIKTFHPGTYNILYVLKFKNEKIEIRLSATTEADHKPSYDALRYCYNNGFNQGVIQVPKILCYFKEINGFFYENIEAETLKNKIVESNDTSFEQIKLAANGLKKLHQLKIPNFKLMQQNWDFDSGMIAQYYPNFAKYVYPIKDNIISKIKTNLELKFCHGDFKADNILIKNQKIYFIDFGLICVSDKELDIATFISNLCIILNNCNKINQFKKLQDLFLLAYGKINIEKFNLYTILINIRLLEFCIIYPKFHNNEQNIPFIYQQVKESLQKINYKI